MPERVMVFIDGANLYTCMRDYLGLHYNVKVDTFGERLASGRELVRIYYYNSPAPPTADQASSQRFWAALGWLNNVRPRQGRIVPKTVNAECPKCHNKFSIHTYGQKGVDTRIVVDIISLAQSDSYDIGIVVSGDSDLAEAIDWVREHTKKRIENYFIACKSWSEEIRKAADVKRPLTKEFLDSCASK
jgi:uncharacterized LabA/DUF88 family protein